MTHSRKSTKDLDRLIITFDLRDIAVRNMCFVLDSTVAQSAQLLSEQFAYVSDRLSEIAQEASMEERRLGRGLPLLNFNPSPRELALQVQGILGQSDGPSMANDVQHVAGDIGGCVMGPGFFLHRNRPPYHWVCEINGEPVPVLSAEELAQIMRDIVSVATEPVEYDPEDYAPDM